MTFRTDMDLRPQVRKKYLKSRLTSLQAEINGGVLKAAPQPFLWQKRVKEAGSKWGKRRN